MFALPPLPPPPPPPPPPAGVVAGLPVRWGLGDVVTGLVVAQLAAIVVSAVVLVAAGYIEDGVVKEIPLGMIAVLQVPLWLGYGGVTLRAARSKGNGLVVDFGWSFRLSDIPKGLAVGVGTQILVVPALYIPIFWLIGERDVSEAARSLTGMVAGPGDVVLLVLVVVVGAPVVEELFFRGLMLRAFERRFSTRAAILLSALIFAGVHFQPLQFPALFAFGLVVAWLAVRSGRLGPAIWAHVGFNGVTVLVLLLTD